MTSALLVGGAALVGLVAGWWARAPIHHWPRDEAAHLRALPRLAEVPARRHDPLVVGGTGALFAVSAAVHGWTGLLPALLVVCWSMVVAVAIDLEFRIIPNRMTYVLAPLVLVLVTVAAAVDGDWRSWRTALIAGVAVPLAMFLPSALFELLRGKPGIGMGDVKWAPALAMPIAYLDAFLLVVWIYGAIISGGIIALVLLATKRAGMASRIPYGPYLAIGAVLALFVWPMFVWPT